MKGGAISPYHTMPGKKRWSWLVIAVLGLVLLSMLVPLAFLLGLHNGFYSGAHTGFTEQRGSASSRNDATLDSPLIKGGLSTPVNGLLRNLGPTLPKDVGRNSIKEAENKTTGFAVPTQVSKPPPNKHNVGVGSSAEGTNTIQVIGESEKMCELKFGSYCLWRQQHREKMKDFIVKKMKDQLYVARAYYPSIAKLPELDQLSQEMKQTIQEFEHIFTDSTSDTDLPPQVETKLQKMETIITKAKSAVVDCNNVDKKLRQLVDLTEDEAFFHMKQGSFLYRLDVQTTPKSLHCLSMRLTVEYFKTSPVDVDADVSESLLNPDLHHYVMFSNNVLASSVVINSTVMHAKASRMQVFHVLTDKQSFFSMKMWFFTNTYKDATIQVLNIEDLDLLEGQTPSHLSMRQELRVSFLSTSESRTEYISTFSHWHYALPKIFPTLKKIIVLDDDIVVQRDLSALWNLDMKEKVIGAVHFCAVKFGAIKKYLGKENYDGNSCTWMSGLNIIDLVRWRERDVTRMFQNLVQQRLAETTLGATMLTFQDLLVALDDTWILSGLGHNYGITNEVINKAAVLHFNGNMKPWLELGIPNYKIHWRKFLDPENRFLTDCNVNP
ncbi:hypothetical protein L1987_21744 [Smallanthus sonchifolius]|uniref:Uncharacterized protein n=1 Tax=Smallanthus sonchifolius TaxID=185202 RepID=A0ACB9IFJ6_9ASTR|nr:hypothetical protein L1987_21744 [Smallanthus sonchifolius]